MVKFILITVLISGLLFCQETIKENHTLKTFQNSSFKDSTYTEVFDKNRLIIPLESFKVFTDPLFIPLNNYDYRTDISNTNNFIPLGFTSNTDYFVYLNKNELLNSLNKKYQLSKPGIFQQILGMFQVGAAAALAGYHIYKYEIKKEKK